MANRVYKQSLVLVYLKNLQRKKVWQDRFSNVKNLVAVVHDVTRHSPKTKRQHLTKNAFMKLKTFLCSLLSLTLLSCGNNDDGYSNNPCELNPSLGINGVTQSDFSIQISHQPDEKGYLISATITNNNPESVSGKPSFVFRENGKIITFSTSNTASSASCLNIDAESSCEFELKIYLIYNQNIDPNIEFLCFYYRDE